MDMFTEAISRVMLAAKTVAEFRSDYDEADLLAELKVRVNTILDEGIAEYTQFPVIKKRINE